MTYFLGLLGILQMMLLPGLILYRLFNKIHEKNFWINLPLIFALSFIFNYFLVFSLTSLHLYTPHIIRSVFFIELPILFFCYPRFGSYPVLIKPTSLLLFDHKNIQDKKYTQAYFWIFLLIFAIWVALWINSIGGVFGVRDPSVSYNIWAIAWSNNQFPTMTWHYPQLLTTNWSIPYTMMGTLPNHQVLEVFPASLNLLFPIFFMLIFLDLFLKEHNRAYLIAGFITSGFMLSAWVYLRSGHMDWVCAYLNLLSLKIIYDESQRTQPTLTWRFYLQIILIMAASALVKPAGITTIILVPLLMVSLIRFQNIKRPELLLCLSYLLLFLLIAPWYIYAQYHETLPSHSSDLLFLIWGIFRFNGWMYFFSELIDLCWAPLILLLISFFFTKSLPRFWRFVFYFFSPYFFIWALFYSYDERNLDLLLPLLALTVGLIISHHNIDVSLTRYFKKQLPKINKLWILLITLIICASAANVYYKWHRAHLLRFDTVMKNQIYDANIGISNLKSFIKYHGIHGKILSPMLIYATIPELQPYMIQLPDSYFGPDMLPDDFNNLANLQKILGTYPDIRYFLFDMRFRKLVTTEESRKVLTSWLNSGKLKVIFSDSNIVLYQIMVPTNQLNYTLPSKK